MALDQMRTEARTLRKQGESINNITRRLQANKSTISYWCRYIVLTKDQIRRLSIQKNRGGELGRLRAAEKRRSARLLATQKEMQRGQHDVGTLKKRDLFILGLALYWGEGYKRGNEECGLTNTSPHIIKTFIVWLMDVYNIRSEDPILRTTLNEVHRARARQIERYWSKETGVPLSQFTRTSFIRTAHTRSFETPGTYFGTLRVKVRRGTALRRRILGSIKEIERKIDRILDQFPSHNISTHPRHTLTDHQ